MPLTDLTGTKWVFDTALDLTHEWRAWEINFISNGTNYASLMYDNNDFYARELWFAQTYASTPYNATSVYGYGDGWTSQAYRIIEITGGADATDATLIAWFEENATQVEVTDLAGTTWQYNKTSMKKVVTGAAGTYTNLSFSATASTYEIQSASYITITSLTATQSGITMAQNQIQLNNAPTMIVCQSVMRVDTEQFSTSNTWLRANAGSGNVDLGDEYVTISFVSGTDCTDPDLILWLTNNATYQAPVQPSAGGMYLGNLGISKIFMGNSEVSKIYLGDALVYEGATIPDNALLTADNTYLVDNTGGYLLTTEI